VRRVAALAVLLVAGAPLALPWPRAWPVDRGHAPGSAVQARQPAVPAAPAAGPEAASVAGAEAASVAGAEAALAADLVARVDAARVLHDVARLSGETTLCAAQRCADVVNRLTGSDDLALAMAYVAEQAAAAGFRVARHEWSSGRWADHNVLARRTGVLSPTELVYVVAHVDGVAGIPSCPGERCPAADDNASGAAAVLELARVLADVPLARSLVLFFSTGEEQGMLGVKAYVNQRTAEELAAIHALVNLDMVGYDGNGDRVMELYHEDHAPSLALARDMRDAVERAGLPLVPRLNPGCG